MKMLCVCCNSPQVIEFTHDRALQVNGRSITVKDDVASKCLDCGEIFYTGEQAKFADRRLADARRQVEGLLTGAEIRSIRESLGLTQSQLEKALGVGPKTVVRWENGTAVQGKAVDDVLRLISFDPNNLRMLLKLRFNGRTDAIESKLKAKDDVKRSELHSAVYAGLKKASALQVINADRTVNAILSEIRRYERRRIDRQCDLVTT